MASTGRNGSSSQNRRNTVNNSNRANNSRNNTNRNRGNSSSRNSKKEYDPRRNEIYLFVYLAVTVFLLLSNFGWCGPIGRFFSNIMFGLFG
ncbi:MAG: hypothetical protein IJ224_10015, partial [Lachnospiraceae bacterium]|nr:hypothetical protein [Lachnospiraceae bacterium]